MRHRKLGNTGLEVSVVTLGCMSWGDPARGGHPWVLDEDAGRPVIKDALEAGHQLLRHRQRLLRRQQRGDHRPGPARLRRPRGRRARHQGARADAARAQRRRPVPQGDHARDRRQPDPARHRLRRPVPDPPLGPAHPDRGDDGGAARRRAGRQGALPRGLVDVRLAVRQGPAHRRAATAGRSSSRCRTTTTCSTARRSARCCRSARTRASG